MTISITVPMPRRRGRSWSALALLGVLPWLWGCAYQPAHLPALRLHRDQFQKLIDDVVVRMASDKAWWSSLSPAERERWRMYLEAMRAEERERAVGALQTIDEGLRLATEVDGGAARPAAAGGTRGD